MLVVLLRVVGVGGKVVEKGPDGFIAESLIEILDLLLSEKDGIGPVFLQCAVFHGWLQAIGDGAAGPTDPEVLVISLLQFCQARSQSGRDTSDAFSEHKFTRAFHHREWEPVRDHDYPLHTSVSFLHPASVSYAVSSFIPKRKQTRVT